MTKYEKQIFIRISQNDFDRMTETRDKIGLNQSEFIRRAIRTYDAEQRIELFKRNTETENCISPPQPGTPASTTA